MRTSPIISKVPKVGAGEEHLPRDVRKVQREILGLLGGTNRNIRVLSVNHKFF